MSVLPLDAGANAAQRAAYWPLPIARAVPALVTAAVITFSADHSARVGMLAFGGFALVTGVVTAALAVLRDPAPGLRAYLVAQGVVGVVLGVVSLSVNTAGIATLLLVVTVWAVITGALELYLGIRTRRRHPASNDWLSVGVLTLLAAVVFLLLPPDIADEFVNADGTTGVLDSAVVAVGLLGAYAAIIGVFLVVAGLSAKWGTRAVPAVAGPDGKDAA